MVGRHFFYEFALVFLSYANMSAQRTAISLHGFDGGSARVGSRVTTLQATVGQVFTGQAKASATVVGSGFLAQYHSALEYYLSMYAVQDGWNLLSLPKDVLDFRKSALYPHAVSSVFEYNGSYVERETLRTGVGYWVKFERGQNIPILGIDRRGDTISVAAGWNIIGSTGRPVPVSSIIQIPEGIVQTAYFGYDRRYDASTIIEPGKGYWVKIKEGGGKLVLSD